MNRLRTILALRRLAAGNNGSACKLYITAPMARLVKPIASRSLDESFCKFARMMSTSGKKRKTDSKDQNNNINEKLKDDSDAAAESSKSPSTVLFAEEIPIPRNDFEIKIMFYGWCDYHNKEYGSEAEEKKRYAIFKDNVKFIEEINTRNLGFRVPLDSLSDISSEELLPKFYFRIAEIPVFRKKYSEA